MPTDPNLILGVVAIAGVAIPCIARSLDSKRKADAEEAEQKRQHEVIMRQSEKEQGLIYTAMNYDFARDVIGDPNGRTSPRFLERIKGILEQSPAGEQPPKE